MLPAGLFPAFPALPPATLVIVTLDNFTTTARGF
jgi:hypothetical protein